MSMNRHQYFEELISASLANDLSDAERAQLDSHLDSCAACRATLASFAEQRRIMAGLRHVAAPRDLGARVRAGVERGAFAPVPWWQRPALMFGGLGGGLAAVAGVLLALVLLNGSPDDSQVGGASESPVPTISTAASASPEAETPAPSYTPVASEPAATPTTAPEPIEPSPEPDVYLAYTGPFDNLALTLRDGRTGETLRELETPSGPPIAAELSPNGQFLAYITQLGESGRNELHLLHVGVRGDGDADALIVATPIPEGATVGLGESVAGSELLERLAWSPNAQYLAYTLAQPDGGGTDVWLFDPSFGEPRQLTEVGNAYAASWVVRRDAASYLWVSTAGEQPMSYLHGVDAASDPNDPDLGGSHDPAANPIGVADGVFQPIVSPNGDWAIYWRGVMRATGDEWTFVQGGSPYLAAHGVDGSGNFGFGVADERELFSDVTIGRDAFTSAGIAWGADSDAYAVWGPQWTGIPQGAGGEYPNVNRVYFGHATDARGLTESHAIDETDIPEGASVVDVKVPTGRHLLITAREPIGGVLEAPRSRLILVTRNTGDVADEVEFLPDEGAEGWFGPAAYDAY